MPLPNKRQPDRTRRKLLECAFEEMHKNGFRAASLDAILERSGVTKGALYHHFGSKAALGYAVVDEVVRPFIEGRWRPAAEADDLLDAAIDLCRQLIRERSAIALKYGCPFNNLINEMSPVDEGFRERLSAILADWQQGIAAALRKGQRQGSVRNDVNPKAAAAFIVAAIEGAVGLGKATQSRSYLEAAFRGLIDYLEHLRAEPASVTRSSHVPRQRL